MDNFRNLLGIHWTDGESVIELSVQQNISREREHDMDLLDINETQYMLMANDLFPLFIQGRKRVTARCGRRAIQLGELLFVATDPGGLYPTAVEYTEGKGHMAQLVEVTKVVYVKMRDVTDAEAQEDGFDNAAHMLLGMKRFYPDLTSESEMSFIYFDVPE
jgi:hypothetical protein